MDVSSHILESLTLAGFAPGEFTKKNLFMHILTEKKEEREGILNASLDTLLQDWEHKPLKPCHACQEHGRAPLV